MALQADRLEPYRDRELTRYSGADADTSPAARYRRCTTPGRGVLNRDGADLSIASHAADSASDCSSNGGPRALVAHSTTRGDRNDAAGRWNSQTATKLYSGERPVA